MCRAAVVQVRRRRRPERPPCSRREQAKEAEGRALLARATIVAFDPTGLDTPNAKAEINSMPTDLSFDILVPASGVFAEERPGGKYARLELLIACVDEEGRSSPPLVIPFGVMIGKPAPDGAYFRKEASFTLDHRWKGRLFVGVRDTATSRLGAVALPIGS